ncbi:uncharacterized protein LOC115680683 isoform X2 [Syzygium oleosum]|uniref:uncharacterized protein LOC115680683 isoform X2 n=1 Tax=Syzygium oleosum TaxID=219896 RepID=UPI0024BB941D|nr:uncharacterized protein LOC115680683 isoform X2 [Syzygium oleosum]
MEEESARPVRLMNFVSEEQLEESKISRGERVEDGTAQRDRPLYEILKENKDKRDAEFNERFKHRPPKALDEDETEFLDKLEMSKREYERQMADEEAQQLQSFQDNLTPIHVFFFRPLWQHNQMLCMSLQNYRLFLWFFVAIDIIPFGLKFLLLLLLLFGIEREAFWDNYQKKILNLRKIKKLEGRIHQLAHWVL